MPRPTCVPPGEGSLVNAAQKLHRSLSSVPTGQRYGDLVNIPVTFMARDAALLPWVSPPVQPPRQHSNLPREGTLNGVEMRPAMEGAHQRAWAHGKDGLDQRLGQGLSLAVHRLRGGHDPVLEFGRCDGAPPG